MKLDQRTVAGLELPPGKREYTYWDEDLRGFGLRLRVSGGRVLRTYIAQHRAAGRTRKPHLGSPEKGVTPLGARKAAKKILAEAALGGDPQGTKAQRRRDAAHTTRSVVDAYLEAKRSQLRPGSLRIAKLYLAGSYFRALHALGITSVTRADVAAAIRAIANTRSDTTAAAARRQLSALFSWAIAEGLLGNGANPVDGSFSPDGPAARDRVLSNDELVAIWRACLDDGFGKIVRLLILLGSRRQEIGGMRWSELDLNTGLWTLPAERAKNKRAHTIALPPPAVAIIRSLMPSSVRDNLFGDRAQIGFTDWTVCKRELDQRLGSAVKPWRLHDLRRTCATGMAEIGIEPHHIEACLNHYGGHRRGVAGVYNRSPYERAVKTALARWSEHVLALVEGRTSNIVALQAS